MSDQSDEQDMDTEEELDPDTDDNLAQAVQEVREQTDAIREALRPICEGDVYSKLSTEDKVKHDIFLAYAMTSLYWMYVKTQGCDPKENVVHSEIERLKEYISRSKKIKERKTMPHLDVESSRRFIRSGLWMPGERTASNKRKRVASEDDD